MNLLLVLILALVSVAQPVTDNETPWQVVAAGPGWIAVPREWRNLDGRHPQLIIFRQGDGIGIPAVDDTGQPLQAGLVVEELSGAKGSLREVASGVAADAKKDSRLQPIGETTFEPVKLSDGSDAVFMASAFVKEGHRRSLQVKLFARSPDARTWMVSGFLVGGKESRWCTVGSNLASWLKVHLTSLTFRQETLDSKPLQEVYQWKPGKKL